MRGYRGYAGSGWGWRGYGFGRGGGFGYRNRGRWCPWRDFWPGFYGHYPGPHEFLRGVEEVVVSDADPRLVEELEDMDIRVVRRNHENSSGNQ